MYKVVPFFSVPPPAIPLLPLCSNTNYCMNNNMPKANTSFGKSQPVPPPPFFIAPPIPLQNLWNNGFAVTPKILAHHPPYDLKTINLQPPNHQNGKLNLLLPRPQTIIKPKKLFPAFNGTNPLEIDCWNTAVSGWEEDTLIKNKIGLIINRRYKILQSIASGSYGAIFVAEDLLSVNRPRVAVKFDAACKDEHLKYEYEYDDGMGNVEGFPQVYWYGHEFGHNIMVMELLGAPLASLFTFCERKFGKEVKVFALISNFF